MKKRLAIIGAVLLLVVGTLVAYSTLADRSTPAGQPPLVELNDQAFEEFKNTFNRDEGRIRVIALLSPT